MLEKFDEMSLVPSMATLAMNLEQGDITSYQQIAGSLGESACYVAAGRIAKLCRYIEHSTSTRDAIGLYPTLIEEAIRLRVYLKIVISRYRGKFES